MEKKYFLSAKLLAFKETNAVFKAENGQEFVWPIKNLPDGLKAGQDVRLSLSTEATEEAEKEKIAKAVLNRILQSNEEKKGGEGKP